MNATKKPPDPTPEIAADDPEFLSGTGTAVPPLGITAPPTDPKLASTTRHLEAVTAAVAAYRDAIARSAEVRAALAQAVAAEKVAGKALRDAMRVRPRKPANV